LSQPLADGRGHLTCSPYPNFTMFLTSRSINFDAELSIVSGHEGEFRDVPHSQAAEGSPS
jgi:hypothetical protein